MPNTSQPHQHSWLGLLAVLGVAIILCLFVFAILAQNHDVPSAQPPAEPVATPEQDDIASTALETTKQSIEDKQITIAERLTVTLPPAYDPTLQYPLVFEYATKAPALTQCTPAHAILASFDATNSATTLESWRNEQFALKSLQELCGKYLIDSNNIYVITNDLTGLSFATRHANRFSALLLRLTEKLPHQAWSALPLGNLGNLPVLLDTSANPVPDANVRALVAALHEANVSNLLLPEHLLALPFSPLPSLLSDLSLQRPTTPQQTLHWETDLLANGEAWWLRAEELTTYGKAASITAALQPRNAPAVVNLTINTKNLEAFSFQRTNPLFARARTFILTVNGHRLAVSSTPSSPEWYSLRRTDNGWQLSPGTAATPQKSPAVEGPIARVLLESALIVYGTGDPETKSLWEACAKEIAAKIEDLTGSRPPLLPDLECKSELLEDKNLILLGSLRENLLVNALLDDQPEFLRQIYQKAPQPDTQFVQNDETSFACIALHPADLYVPGKLALILIADDPALIPSCTQPLFSSLALQGDYLLFSPEDSKPVAIGWCTHDWQIEE